MAKANDHGRALLAELRVRLQAAGGAVQLQRGDNVFRLKADEAWLSANGEAFLDLTALVHVHASKPLKQYLVPAMELKE